MRSLLVVCVLITLVALTPAPGVPGSANAETISIIASDNAEVQKVAPDVDQSEATKLMISGDGSGTNGRFAYFRFDVTPLAGATITSASLDVYWASASNDNTLYVCALKDLASAGGVATTETSWSGNLTWNTRPDGTGSLPNDYTSGQLASLPRSGNTGKVARFDLTSALPGLLMSDTNSQLTLILHGGANTRWNEFASLANTAGKPVPTLSVTGEGFNPEAAIPEPGTLALLGMAVLGLGWYAWRKVREKGPMKFPVYIPAVLLALSITSIAYANEGSTSGWISKADYGLMAHYQLRVDKLSPEEYNRGVNSFNVDSFVKQVKESGAGYVILTLGQNSGYYCAPNRTYDKLLGVEPGQKTATRDLPLELGKALQKENIRLMLYLPSRAPQRDAKAMSALGDVSQREPAPQVFIKNWSDICREWSERYGKLVSGWWFDGYYVPAGWADLQAEHNWKTWAEAVRAGNPDAELAFNGGFTIAYTRMNGAQTYTSGHTCGAHEFAKPPKDPQQHGGMQWHHLTYLGRRWGRGSEPRYSADRLIPYVDEINALGGIITFDVPLSAEGVIPESFMTVLRELAKKNRS